MNELTWRDAQAYWEELHYATDPAADYSFDDIVLFKNGNKYALFFDSGCSCPSPFEDNPKGDVYTKRQLLNVVSAWGQDEYDRTERVMKDWIVENIK